MEGKFSGATVEDYDWTKFDETKAGVKGLVDSGILKIPNFFVDPSAASAAAEASKNVLELPTVDLHGVESDAARRNKAVSAIREAAGKWGFFRMVGHGVPTSAMDGVLEATRRFHEFPKEEKAPFYSTVANPKLNPRFFTVNGGSLPILEEGHVASWKDALAFNFFDGDVNVQALPPFCRKEVGEYIKNIQKLGNLLSELFSEALGLRRDYLAELEIMKSQHLSCIYYPPCPEPDRAFGLIRHTDTAFITVVLEDDKGGLQLLHQDQWVNVTPVPGSLLVNIGDRMQLITNDKFKSVEHRVLTRSVGTRVSAACFFFTSKKHSTTPYGPIKELLSESRPALYREASHVEYTPAYNKHVKSGVSTLSLFKK